MPSIYKILSQAGANSSKFVPFGNSGSLKYHTKDFDATFFSQQFAEWENSSKYAQKYQYDDKTTLQFHTNSSGSWSLQLVNCDGVSVKNYPVSVATYPGNIRRVDGIDFPMITGTFDISFVNTDSVIPEGIYYFKLTLEFDTQTTPGYDETGIWYSEPILLMENHIDTVLCEYTSARAQFNTIFGTKVFSQRLEGNLVFQGVDSNDTQFNDSNYDMFLLNSYPWRKYKFYFGGVSGVANWVLDKLNIIFGCQTVKVDGKPLTKDEGAKFNITQSDHRVFGDLDCREPINYNEQTLVAKSAIVLFTVPTSAIALRRITLDAFVMQLAHIVDPSIIGQTLSYLNTTVATMYSLTGTFQQQGNKIVYIVGQGESYQSGSAITLTKSFVLQTSAANTSWVFNTYSKWAVVEWMDGAITGYGNGSYATIGYTHADSPFAFAFQITVWHEDSIQTFSFSDPKVIGITGTMPTVMTELKVDLSSMTSIDANIFPSVTSLTELRVRNSQLNTVSNLNRPWAALVKFDFTGNKFSSAGVSNVIISTQLAADSSIPLQSGVHSLLINGQTPAAPPTTAGSFAKNILTSSYGWTVTTD